MTDAFNDDLSADMTDPEFAAEFERTTDEVRRECPPGVHSIFDPCPGNCTEPVADDRRERYAAAIAEAAEPNDLDIGHWIHEWYPEADAAIAMADEEIRGLAQELVEMGGDLSARRREGERLIKLNRDLVRDCRAAHEDSARLRAELAESRRKECDALCSDVERDRDEYESNISRLRAELDQLKKAAKIVTENRWYERLGRAEDTISRVRAVLDEWYGTSDASALSAEIRTALSGESS